MYLRDQSALRNDKRSAKLFLSYFRLFHFSDDTRERGGEEGGRVWRESDVKCMQPETVAQNKVTKFTVP